MYYIYGISGSSLLIESTDSMMQIKSITEPADNGLDQLLISAVVAAVKQAGKMVIALLIHPQRVSNAVCITGGNNPKVWEVVKI